MKVKYKAADCQSFAGGFALGMVQAGFELVTKCEMKGGFGVANMEANRVLLGDSWTTQVSVGKGDDWQPVPADVVFGNPPCSGFSLLSRKDFRGPDSIINECMWRFAWYAACVRPQIAVFESVQQAYSGGLVLMRALRDKLEADTGEQWDLHHVLHNAASVGGGAIRRRYFWVVSRVPFGVDPPVVHRVPVLDDVIGDLQGLAQTWERQPYRRPPSWWSASRRDPLGVDGHIGRSSPAIRRALELLNEVPWDAKENLAKVAERYFNKMGKLPDSWGPDKHQKYVENGWQMGFNQLTREHGRRMARVITGGGLDMSMHPYEDRTYTHREVARIQGFPDDWRILPLRGVSGLSSTWGKGIPVDCGRWIGGWIKNALDGNPGQPGVPGEMPREFIHDSTAAYRAVSSER